MSEVPRADVSLLHVAGGEARSAPPPGTLALSAPKRSARGRAHDFLFINLKVAGSHGDGRPSRLAHFAAQAFFGTPGSVTSALRQSAITVNETLNDGELQADMVVGALRNNNLYYAQCGQGESILVRSGTVNRTAGTGRPLGTSLAPMIQFRHFEVQAADLIILTTAGDTPWSDVSLSGLAGLDLRHSSDRLLAATDRDLTGAVIQIPGLADPTVPLPATTEPARSQPPPTHGEQPQTTREFEGLSPVADSARPAEPPQAMGARSIPASTRSSRIGSAARPGAGVGIISAFRSRRLHFWIRRATDRVSRLLLDVVVRLAPGTLDSRQLGALSPNLLALTAAAVPILVVGLSSLVYFKHGRNEQFDSYLSQAQSSVVAAQMQPLGEESRSDWVMASQWLDLAESYRTTDESSHIRTQVQAAMDQLDLVVRLEFTPAVSGGFGPKAELVSVAATTTDLYTYDEGNRTIWHAWSTGRGYEMDNQFECLAGADSIPDFQEPVSIVIQPEPGALGTEGVVAIDRDGTLLYCAPGAEPLTSELSPPDVGWGKIQAIAVFGNDLYVLDPVKNAVWIYDAADGLFSGSSALYFVEQVRELGTAIDLALAQDELIILYADGGIDRCRRSVENTPEGDLRIRVECETDPQFQDERHDFQPQPTIPGAEAASLVYSPPPEPSLFILDSLEGSVFHYSMRLVYQGEYPTAFDSMVNAITSAPPNDLYVAAGDQIYYAQLGR